MEVARTQPRVATNSTRGAAVSELGSLVSRLQSRRQALGRNSKQAAGAKESALVAYNVDC
jgi:hypothetical protein